MSIALGSELQPLDHQAIPCPIFIVGLFVLLILNCLFAYIYIHAGMCVFIHTHTHTHTHRHTHTLFAYIFFPVCRMCFDLVYGALCHVKDDKFNEVLFV